MAKRGRRKSNVNKTLEIKTMLDADANASPKAISAALAEKGIKTSPAYVSSIKSKLKKSGGAKRTGRRGGRRAMKVGDEVSISKLVETKRFANKMGGVENLKKVIDALAKLD
jgi:DNA-binding IscR family transcriptional regulator